MTPPFPPRPSRRQLLQFAAAAAAGLAVGGCSPARGSGGGLRDEPTETSALSSTTPPSAALVGDSIAFLSRGALETKLVEAGFGKVEFDALPGRRIAEGDSSGLAVLDFAIGAGLTPDLWVIELGTNDLGHYAGDAAYAELIDLVMQRVPGPTPLIWVDTYSSFQLDAAELFNRKLRDAIVARGNAAVGDWYAKCVEVGPTVLIPDGLHPSPEGFEIFAEVTVAPISLVA
jgi:hypothetical protein